MAKFLNSDNEAEPPLFNGGGALSSAALFAMAGLGGGPGNLGGGGGGESELSLALGARAATLAKSFIQSKYAWSTRTATLSALAN